MKRASSNLCNGILITSLLFSVNDLRSNDDWTGKEYALAAVVVAGCAYGLYYLKNNMQESNHSNWMDEARAAMDRSKSITYENGSESNEDENVRLLLAKYKEDLNKKWIYVYEKGLNINASIRISGTMSASNLFCFYLYLSGQGFVNNSTASSATSLDGNFVIENSRLSNIDLEQGTKFATFNNCLLGHIKSKNAAIIELQKAVVDGNIVFDKSRPGVVIIDKESIISGSLENGRLVRNIPVTK